jgi:hypothetical protein
MKMKTFWSSVTAQFPVERRARAPRPVRFLFGSFYTKHKLKSFMFINKYSDLSANLHLDQEGMWTRTLHFTILLLGICCEK